eukprot:CAMPEP_0118843846 /NCGR_PEP_ID=MMETSP1162-20130426/83920_1 /TAXON_ID=33656 /ORGANISM="Phaeocystis Sp, Strain CCMP2710" /LENGTH=80 /DNA_ID=CAMNT_0006775949 /DNA_START=135 /DNA_END=374 /DNA_ORIENTATION=+
MARHCARERATLRRLALSTKGMPWAPPPASAAAAESSSKSEWVSETIETGASWPWNRSTVPTRAPRGSIDSSSRTCALYG